MGDLDHHADFPNSESHQYDGKVLPLPKSLHFLSALV